MRVVSFSLLLVLTMNGLCLETKLITPAELRKRVLMTPVCDFTKMPLSVRTRDFLLTSSNEGPLFSLRGLDTRGRRWRVILRDAIRGAWSSEAAGSRTYYFAGYTGGAGMAPEKWLLVLSFDESGRPVPFFVITHGGYDKGGIEDVLDLDGTGPELLEQRYWGSIREDPGYYVTTLYQKRGFYWYRSDGQHGSHVFPAFEKWSVMWKDRPAELVAEPPFKRPVRDSSNDPANGIPIKIAGAEERAIRVPQIGCASMNVEVLVTDSAKGREIDLQPGDQSLIRTARARSVIVTGLYRRPGGRECDASILWVWTNR